MKSLYLIRHGPAETRSASGRDADRALTDEGAEKTALCAAGFARIAQPDVVLSSPLLRARQTAELFARAVRPKPTLVVVDELGPVRDPVAVLKLVNARRAESTALVGHEPDMGAMTGWLIAPGRGPAGRFVFKKPTVARIDFDPIGPAVAGAGALAWLLPPKALVRLGQE